MDIITQENKPVAHLAFIVAEVSHFCLLESSKNNENPFKSFRVFDLASSGLVPSWNFHRWNLPEGPGQN